jgi:hypothetical protein
MHPPILVDDAITFGEMWGHKNVMKREGRGEGNVVKLIRAKIN